MRKILVALDGSSQCEKALESAVRMAQKEGSQVTAVAVLDGSDDPRRGPFAAGAKAHARRHLEEVLEAAVNFARSRGVLLTPILREGHPAEAIIGCAEQEGAEIVVLGGGGTQASRLGLGGTADRVTGHAPCAVMVVK